MKDTGSLFHIKNEKEIEQMEHVAQWLVRNGYRFYGERLEWIASFLFDSWCLSGADVSLERYLDAYQYASRMGEMVTAR